MAYKSFEVPVKRIEKLTGLNFGQLRNVDPKKNLESDLEGLESLDPDQWYWRITGRTVLSVVCLIYFGERQFTCRSHSAT